MRSRARIRNGITGAAALAAASVCLAAAPAVALAQQGHEHGHVAAGGHYAPRGGPVVRGGMHGGIRGGMHMSEGPRYFGGPRYGGHFVRAPRYAVPSHWVGMHPHWGGPRPGYWVRPWGPRWVPHYWAGGYWRGGFWPHVYLGWDFPWFLAALPVGYATYWWGGVPYYYWQGVYYVWNPDYGQYVVTDPPPVTGSPVAGAAPPPSEQPGDAPASSGGGAMSMYVYPKNGQSEKQTQDDRYQCHQWAVGQTGFDPTNTAGTAGAASGAQASTATPANYKRAVTACLQARGYSVR